MFYSDYGVHVYKTRISNYILRFARHFDVYVNSSLVQSVPYESIVWC